MKSLIDLDMNRIFDATEVAVKERAARIIQESREEQADAELRERRNSERALACEQEAQRIVDTIPERIASCIANGEQQLLLLAVSHGHYWGYDYGAARVIEETQVKHNVAVAALVLQKCSGIDKLRVVQERYQQVGLPGGFFVRLFW